MLVKDVSCIERNFFFVLFSSYQQIQQASDGEQGESRVCGMSGDECNRCPLHATMLKQREYIENIKQIIEAQNKRFLL